MASLRANGCKVIDLSVVGGGCPDLLALLPDGTLKLIEVKNPSGRDRINIFLNVSGETLLSSQIP